MNFDKEIFYEYLKAGYAVVPVNKKIPVLKDWNNIDYSDSDIIEDWYKKYTITGLGIIMGGPNRNLGCIDVDSNDNETVEKILKHYPSKVVKIGMKGCTIFFLTDGNHTKSQYKFQCPGGSGFVEVFYSNKQVVIPPSLHSDDNYYYWKEDGVDLLRVGYDNLPLITHEQIEALPYLINSPSLYVANINLPKNIQYTTDDLADGRYSAMMDFFARTVAKYNQRPSFKTALLDCLNFDAEFFPKNSFFLHSTNKKRAEMKTEDRAINCSAWMNSVMVTFNRNSGASWGEADELTSYTESFAFSKLIPIEQKIAESTEPHFDNAKLLPPLWEKMITDMSGSMGCPTSALFISHMASLGACLQAKKIIKPLKNDNFFRRPNLAICLVAASGSKKSDVVSISTHMCNKIDKKLKTINPKKLLDKMQSIQDRIEQLHKDKRKLSASGEIEEATRVSEEIIKLQESLEKLEIKPTVWMYEIATIQKMILDASKNQGNGLFLVLDEFKQILAMMKKKGNEDARTFFMKGIDGTKDFRYATIARGTDVIENHFISILTCIQPDVLNVIINDLHNPRNDSNDGFHQRFQMVSFGMPKMTDSKSIDMARYAREQDLFVKAFESTPETVHIDENFLDIYDEMRRKIVIRANEHYGKPVGSFLSKQEGLLCVYAYLYEFILSEGQSSVISLEALNMAFDLLTFFADEVKYLFSVSDSTFHNSELFKLEDMVKNRFFIDGLTQAQWWQNARGSFNYSTSFNKCVLELESRGYLARVRAKENSHIIKINPAVYSV